MKGIGLHLEILNPVNYFQSSNNVIIFWTDIMPSMESQIGSQPMIHKCCPLKSETSKKPHCVLLCRNQWPTRPFSAYQILSLPFEHLINHLIMNSELFEKQMSYLMNFYYIEFFSNPRDSARNTKQLQSFNELFWLLVEAWNAV